MTQLAKKIFQAGQKNRLHLWEEHLEDPLAALAKALECLENSFFRVGIWFHSLSLPAFVVAIACSIVGAKICKRCGKGPIGKASGLTWTHVMLCVCAQHPASGEIRVARRALFLPHQEGASCSHKGSAVKALCSCGDAQCMCFDWSTPYGSRRCLWDLLILWCLFAGAGRDSRTLWSEVPSVERRCILLRE